MPVPTVGALRLNMTVQKQLFLLREKNLSITRMGQPLLRVVLADRTGTIPGVQFDVPGNVADSLVVGGGVEVTGRVGEFRGQTQLTIERIAPAELVDLQRFLPMARRPMEEMKAELDALCADVLDPDLSRLLNALLDDPEVYRAFTEAPAAKVYHHACVGGLLEHSLSVARIVLASCDLYPEMNHDLALTAALLHDIGKIRAYDRISFEPTEEGRLWTHVYVGASIVEQAIARLEGFDEELRLRLVHALLAHHGRLENGSPVVPMTLEAIVLHYADNLDGDARGAIDHLNRGEDGASFTERSAMHETVLFRGSSISD
jgi:3'-5' exoribonuclease